MDKPDDKKDRPGLAVDIDGVILNFSEPFAQWYNLHDAYPNYLPSNPKVWAYGTVPKQVIGTAIDAFLGADPYPTLGLMDPQIPQYLESLREHYTLWIVTNRKKRWMQEGLRNLERYGITRGVCYDHIVFAEGDKRDTLRQMNAVGIIDDKPLTAVRAGSMGIPVYMPTYWNYVKEFRAQHDDPNIHFYCCWGVLVHLLIHKAKRQDEPKCVLTPC